MVDNTGINAETETKEKLLKLLSSNGVEYFYNAVQEESAELIKAISHLRRKKPNFRQNLVVSLAQAQIVMDILKICVFPVNQEKTLFEEIYQQELDKMLQGEDNG